MHYAVCYAETSGLSSDATWRDSYVRFKITKITSISINAQKLAASYAFKVSGHLPNIADLQITYRCLHRP